MRKNNLKVYKKNDVYRLGDLFYRPHSSGLRWAEERKIILSDAQYSNTILYDYLSKKTKENDFDLLRSICFDHIKKNNYSKPLSTELVVHLRLGDRMDHCSAHETTDDSFISYLSKIDFSKISKVSILAVANFAGYKENWDSRYDEERLNQSISRFNAVVNFFKNLNLDVSHFSKSIDEDFCYGVSSNHLLTTTGGFSRLLSKLFSGKLYNLS